MERWANKVAVVTGAASGMGAQFSQDLCSHNVTVVGLDFKEELLNPTAAAIVSKNPLARFIPVLCDLTVEEEISAAFDRIIKEMGGVDILINCAGIYCGGPVLQEGGADLLIKQTIQTNLLAPILCIKRAFKSMADRDVDGHIVNISSVLGHVVTPLPGLPPASIYCVTKSALKTLNQMIGQELVHYKNRRVRISNISPGIVGGTNILKDTQFHNLVLGNDGFKLTPKDVSDALIFILSAPQNVQVRDVIIESTGACLY